MVIALVIILAAVCLEVFWRFALGGSIPWSGELATVSLVWMVFLAGSYAVSTKANIRIEILVRWLSAQTRRWLEVAIDLVLLVLFVVLLVIGVRHTRVISGSSTYTLGISQGYVYAAVPVAAAFMLFYTVLNLIEGWREAPPAGEGSREKA
jgi:TRAP-type C4-dicarboxylate transport system permease small subunit